jgi:hypothetical protein
MRSFFLAFAVLASCAQPVRRFPNQAPLWNDGDRAAVAAQPKSYFSGMWADGADQMAFRPLARAFTVPLADESLDVNSLDEVPNSAWFTNRIGIAPLSSGEIREGACATGPRLDGARGPWLVTGAKPDGANPGFFVTAPDGSRYLLKFDGTTQPQRATSADVVGSKLYHAFGYHTPCNEVVWFKESVLAIAPKATRKNELGETVPITRADVDVVLAAAYRKDGLLRASASRFLPGKPLGPFRYEATRSDDRNDLVAHERRRELRGGRLFAAWLNHFDTREQNTLDVWVDDGGRRYVRHYYLDFGDAFGSTWPQAQISRRLGYTGYVDFDHVAGDFFTLGLLDRPWHHPAQGPESTTFGYFSERQFVPSQWRGGYANPAFERMTDGDAQWAVRILARLGETEVRAAVSSAQLPERQAEVLVETLMARRKLILDEYATRRSPLTRFMLVRRHPNDPAQSLCFEDDAARTGAARASAYRVRFVGGQGLDEELGAFQFTPDPKHPHRSCVRMPVTGRRPADLAGAAPDNDPLRYGVLEIVGQYRGSAPRVRVHLYDLGPARGFRLVGIERPSV